MWHNVVNYNTLRCISIMSVSDVLGKLWKMPEKFTCKVYKSSCCDSLVQYAVVVSTMMANTHSSSNYDTLAARYPGLPAEYPTNALTHGYGEDEELELPDGLFTSIQLVALFIWSLTAYR